MDVSVCMSCIFYLAALSDSSLFYIPITDRILSPTTAGYTGATLSPPSQTAQQKEKVVRGPRKETKETQPRVGPAHPRCPARDLLFVPILVHSSPGRLRRRPTPHLRVFQKLYHRPNSVILPEPPQRWRPRLLPPTIFSHSPPQFPDLRGPCPALRKKVMPRLSPPTVAPTVARRQPLGARHTLVQEGSSRRVSWTSLFVCLLLFLSRCVGPEGPWQRGSFIHFIPVS